MSELLSLLAITKQSLGRVLTDLGERGLVETRARADRDRRQRLLNLTNAGKALENELCSEALRERLSAGLCQRGPGRSRRLLGRCLRSLIPEGEQRPDRKARQLKSLDQLR